MTGSSATPSQELISKLDTGVPHSARVWNYWLGGKDNFPVDRQVGDQVRAVFPAIVENARASRAFLARAVRYLAGEAGIRQFLDIGTGLPTANNTHQVAQSVAPETRIVYVDNDPLVLTHARALLTSSPEGATDYIDADVREPGKILQEAARTLEFAQPVALMMLGILGNVADYNEARSIVKRLLDGVPSGSYLVVNDGTNTSEEIVEARASRARAATRTPSAAPRRSLASSTVWTSRSPAWSLPHGGGPSPAHPASLPSWTGSAASRASRRPACGAGDGVSAVG